jgi:hypothetical protein
VAAISGQKKTPNIDSFFWPSLHLAVNLISANSMMVNGGGAAGPAAVDRRQVRSAITRSFKTNGLYLKR